MIVSMNYLQMTSATSSTPADGTQLSYRKATDGTTANVKTYRANPGDLQFFMGRYCLHQISQVLFGPVLFASDLACIRSLCSSSWAGPSSTS